MKEENEKENPLELKLDLEDILANWHSHVWIMCDCLQPGCSYCDSDGSRTKWMREWFDDLNLKDDNEK